MKEYGVVPDPTEHVPGNETYKVYRYAVEERFWATVFIINACNARYGGLKKDLANTFIKGQNDYPLTSVAAYELLLRYAAGGNKTKLKTAPTGHLTSDSEEDESEVDKEDPDNNKFNKAVAFANGSLIGSNCSEGGQKNLTSPCSSKSGNDKGPPKKKGVAFASFGVSNTNGEESDDSSGDEFGKCGFCITIVGKVQQLTSTQQIILANKELISKHWILLDSQSTINIFKWKNCLQTLERQMTRFVAIATEAIKTLRWKEIFRSRSSVVQ